MEKKKKWEYTNESNKRHSTVIPIRLNYVNDADILEKLTSLDNKTGYIKNLIRKDLKG